MKCIYYKPHWDTLRKIIGEYYQLEGCACGGPLHILLDDDNYDIGSVRWCIEWCFEGLTNPNSWQGSQYSKEAFILGIMICNEYAKMSLEERAVFDSYLNGDPLDCGDWSSCSACRVFGELHEHMAEVEEAANEKIH